MNQDSLFVMLGSLKLWCLYHALGSVGNDYGRNTTKILILILFKKQLFWFCSMSTGATRWFCNVMPMVQELLISNKFIIENSIHSKLKFLRKLGCTFGIVENCLMIGYYGGDFVIFRPEVEEILGLEWSLSLEIEQKLNKIKIIVFWVHTWANCAGHTSILLIRQDLGRQGIAFGLRHFDTVSSL
jgi:hypothetical protein